MRAQSTRSAHEGHGGVAMEVWPWRCGHGGVSMEVASTPATAHTIGTLANPTGPTGVPKPQYM